MQALLAGLGDTPFVFIVGKGGVGKTTAAGALGLGLADGGARTHLITTDPAESLSDLFGIALADGVRTPSPCTQALTLEAFDARRAAERWLAPRRSALAEIVERGTYLETTDVDAILALAVPGVDEAMGALRLVDLAALRGRGGIDRIVVDTAPTGHTLRLLDAGAALTSWIDALRAMARKAAVVASAMLHAPVRLQGERVLDELENDLANLEALLREAAFVVVHRGGAVVRAETERLIGELGERGLRVRALVVTGDATPLAIPVAGVVQAHVPLLRDAIGCAGLQQWAREVVAGPEAAVQAAVRPSPGPAAAPSPAPAVRPAAAWMRSQSWQLVWFAGKGGVGKSTCAAAAALGLSDTRPIALHSTDPAGSLGEVFGRPIGAEPLALTVRLRVQQVDATAAFDVWRAEYRAEVAAVFEQLGIAESVALDRRVLESALDLAPLGIDEIVALDHIIDAMEGGETLIIDTAPTGHFLRLLEMPGLALDWAHALLRILLHHGGAGSLADVSQRVLVFAKRLKVLRSTLADPERAAVFVVTLDEPMVRAETERLRAALRAAAIPEAAVIMNRATAASSCAAARVVRAPDCAVPPQGAAALRTFFDAWELA